MSDARRTKAPHPVWRRVRLAVMAVLLGVGLFAWPHPINLADQPPFVDHPLAAEGFEASLSFIAVGDTGWGNAGQRRVAAAMSAITAHEPIDLVLLLGDNFYPDGVQSTADPMWAERFEAMYRLPGLSVPFYAVLGNHDYHGNVTAQIERTSLDARWRMSGAYYAWTAHIDEHHDALFVALDTEALHDPIAARAQMAWLEQTLAESRASWKIVLGHHPIIASGDVKVHPQHAALVAVLQSHAVAAYFCGHKHQMGYFHRGDSGLCQIISGAGSKPRKLEGEEAAAFASDALGIVCVRMSRDTMLLSFINADGRVLYTDSIPRPARTASLGRRDF